MLKQLYKVLFGHPTTKTKDLELVDKIDKDKLPQHIAIIMDGNGRWAQKRGLPRTLGHRAGVESLKAVVEACGQVGVRFLTVYAFSTENWKRPQEEVDVLMNLITEYIDQELETLNKKGVGIATIGKIENLPKGARESLAKAKATTAKNNKIILNLALNYGSRAEIINAVQEIGQLIEAKKIRVEDINESIMGQLLYTANMPEPDLLIRPSGEYRLSNFLLWQLAYTEFWYTETLWPDFREEDLYQAIIDYQSRERRFGGIKL